MFNKRFRISISALVAFLAAIAITTVLVARPSGEHWVTPKNKNIKSASPLGAVKDHFPNPNCGSVDFSSYVKYGGSPEESRNAFACFESALRNCSPAHINLDNVGLLDGTTKSITYGVEGSQHEDCIVDRYFPDSGSGEVCKLVASSLRAAFSDEAIPGFSVFAFLHVSLQRGKASDSSNQPLSCFNL